MGATDQPFPRYKGMCNNGVPVYTYIFCIITVQIDSVFG